MPNQTTIAQVEAPKTMVPTITIRQPDGSILVKAGRPVIIPPMMTTKEAARILNLGQRTVEYQCSVGLFKTACKPGGAVGSKWMVARSEVMARLQPPAD